MGRQLSSQYWTNTRKMGQLHYCSVDGRFEVCDNWSVDSVREPNWLLIDRVTGRSYRFFVRLDLEQKIETLLAQTDRADIKTPKHD